MNKSRGFTLIEILIAVAIISILAGIAWPAWQNYITRSHRTAAQACLMQQAQFMERFYTQNMSYSTSRDGSDVDLPDGGCISEMNGNYSFEIEQVDDSSYLLMASPQGVQENRDTQCGVLSVDHTGRKTASMDGDGVGRCW